MTNLYDKYDELLDEIEMLKARADIAQGEINRRQEMILLLRRALEPFALEDTKIGRWITSKDRDFARETMQLTAPKSIP